MGLHVAQIIQLQCRGTGWKQIARVLLLKKAEYCLSLFSRNANSSDMKLSEIWLGALFFSQRPETQRRTMINLSTHACDEFLQLTY